MAWLIGDSFDFETATVLAPGSIWSAGGVNSMGGGRFAGSQAAAMGNFTSLTSIVFANSGTIWLNFAINLNPIVHTYPVAGDGTPIWGMAFFDGVHGQCSLLFNRDTTMSVGTQYLTSSGLVGTKVFTSPAITQLAPNVWNHIQAKFVIDNVNGSVEVRFNGELTPTWSASNINTRNGTTNNQVNNFYMSGFSNWSFGTAIDDIYLFNDQGAAPNDWQGDVRAIPLMPNSDVFRQWAPSTGISNWNLVDERPANGDTDYVSDTTPGDTDTYSITPFSSPPLAIVGVQTKMYARKDDASDHQVQTKLISGGTTSTGVTNTLASTYSWFIDKYMLNPDTGTAWNQASVEAAQIGPINVT